jgi:hypothetical protein
MVKVEEATAAASEVGRGHHAQQMRWGRSRLSGVEEITDEEASVVVPPSLASTSTPSCAASDKP